MALTFTDLFSALGYTLSLPERLLRSLAGTIGGTTKLITDTLLPEPLRNTNTYTAIVGNAQRFLIEKVADVHGAYAETGAALPEDYVQRAVAGNIISTVGILSIHMSPLWVFAIVSDVAHGSKVYLDRLVTELKSAKVIPADSTVGGVDELLDTLNKAGKDTAQVFDTPPIHASQIRELRDRLLSGYSNVFKNAADMLPRMDDLWSKMEDLGSRDGVARQSIVGLMTLDLGQAAGKIIAAAYAIGSATTDMLAETIFQSYGETLLRLQNKGVSASLEEASQPYLEAVTRMMSTDQQTWTERMLNRAVHLFRPSDKPA